MLNKNNERELAYLVRVDSISPMDADRLECAHVGGWNCVVGKGEFKPGDAAVYFEIDSKIPEERPFVSLSFLASKKFKIKSQKIRGVISQGLLVPVSLFNWVDNLGGCVWIPDENRFRHCDDESRFVTEKLGVTYAVVEDNVRKARTPDRSKVLAQKYPKFFSNPIIRRLMHYDWFRKFIVYVFPTPVKRNTWPSHIAAKTDVERIQNMMWVLDDKKPFVATEKVDGTSCSIMAEKKGFNRIQYYVCSRNVVFTDRNQKCFYEDNVYFEAFEKYNFRDILPKIMQEYDLTNIAIQMEVYGDGIQQRDYSLKNQHQIAVFHIVSNGIKFPMEKTVEICEEYGLPHVSIVDANYILPDTLEELQEFVESEPSDIDGGMREGIVFYDKETGQQYFKFVSPNYLLTYHS